MQNDRTIPLDHRTTGPGPPRVLPGRRGASATPTPHARRRARSHDRPDARYNDAKAATATPRRRADGGGDGPGHPGGEPARLGAKGGLLGGGRDACGRKSSGIHTSRAGRRAGEACVRGLRGRPHTSGRVGKAVPTPPEVGVPGDTASRAGETQTSRHAARRTCWHIGSVAARAAEV